MEEVTRLVQSPLPLLTHRTTFLWPSGVFLSLFIMFSGVKPSHGQEATSSQQTASKENLDDTSLLVVDEPTFDFGTVPQGTIVEHTFLLRNTGKLPIEIRQIHPACGCTTAALGSTSLGSGATALLKVKFDTTGFEGYKVKGVKIYTNSTERPNTTVSLQGKVKLDVEIDPPRVYFGRVVRGSSKEKKVTLLSEKDSAIKILDISPRSDQIQLDIEDVTIGERTGKKIVVHLRDSIPVGIFRNRIIVKTSSPANPVRNIPVFARVEGDLILVPSEISLGLREGPLTKSITETVKLVNTAGTPVRVLSIQSDHPNIQAAFRPLHDKKTYEVQITVKEKASGMLRAQVEIITDHPDKDQQKLTLPIYGIIQRRGA